MVNFVRAAAFSVASLCCLLPCGRSIAAVVGKAVTPEFSGLTGELGVTNFQIGTPAGNEGLISSSGFFINFGSAGDSFGYTGRDGGSQFDSGVFRTPVAFQFLDDSLAEEAQGRQDPTGIIYSTDFGTVFGSTDTMNGETSNTDPALATFSATWTFDISGRSGGLGISVDAAAMGDFESKTDPTNPDKFDFTYSLDGGATFLPLFTSEYIATPRPEGNFVTIPETVLPFPSNQGQLDLTAPNQSQQDFIDQGLEDILYTMESGMVYAFPDPMSLEGVTLDNTFKTVNKAIGETAANSLMIRFESVTNGGSEAFLFKNLTIEDGVVAPGLDGDYNNDNVVDAADYTVWRDGGSPDSSQAGYDLWAANYGDSLPANAASIPEPTAALLAMIALAGLASRRS